MPVRSARRLEDRSDRARYGGSVAVAAAAPENRAGVHASAATEALVVMAHHRRAAGGRTDDVLTTGEDCQRVFGKRPCFRKATEVEQRLTAARLCHRKLDFDAVSFENVERRRPDLRGELIDVAGDEQGGFRRDGMVTKIAAKCLPASIRNSLRLRRTRRARRRNSSPEVRDQMRMDFRPLGARDWRSNWSRTSGERY